MASLKLLADLIYAHRRADDSAAAAVTVKALKDIRKEIRGVLVDVLKLCKNDNAPAAIEREIAARLAELTPAYTCDP